MQAAVPNEKILEKLQKLHSELRHSARLMDEPYKAPKHLLRKANKEGFPQKVMQELSDHMGFYLKISARVHVHVVTEKQLYEIHGKDSAGLYKTHGLTHREIWLVKKKEFRLKNMLAILAHEYTHNFLNHHGVRELDSYQNELLTDTAALYIGFGGLLHQGYQPIIWHSDYQYQFGGGYKYKRNELRLGYIQLGNISYGIKNASRMREAPSLTQPLPLWEKLLFLPGIIQMRLKKRQEKRKADLTIRKIQDLFRDLSYCREQSMRLPGLLDKPAPETKDMEKQRLRVEMANEVSMGALPLHISSLEKRAQAFKRGGPPNEKELNTLLGEVNTCKVNIAAWLEAFDALR